MERQEAGTPPGGAAIRIAIVEDDPAMAAWLAGVIAPAEGLRVVATASTAAEGEALVAAGGYDVLLCDLGLPDGDGIALIRGSALRHPGADVMVVTMFAEQRRVIDCIRAGARGYLLKDMEPEACVAAIRDVRRGGSPISPAIARQVLRHIRPEPQAGDATLTDRERDVLNMLARGFSKKECAELLGLSVNTVGTHVKSIYVKLEVNSRAEAVFEASSQGILD
ncbi:MAG: response regulator transcription factor [Phenylobacterium sp.]|uniref:response regulator n=1 Tax=Phenylobacterium sp. TaxID=1871053 RepID=UPI001A633B6C|nr:response regulator transcription factor [Phenylobacterium sp.]MBL8772681.1 response regulator transcription factor [Phenylobacterium sp.]